MVVERRIKEASALRDFIHEQWQFIVEMLSMGEHGSPERQDDVFPVEEAIDELVQGTDARVRAVHNYKDLLRSGARKLLGHIEEIVEQLDGPIRLTRKSFVYNSQVSSLLGSMQEVKRLCDESDEVQEYLKSFHAQAQEIFYALLFMHYHEKEIFGDELRGDFIHRDVKQTSVYFTGHRFMAPAASEQEVRSALKHILLEDVVEYLKLLLSRERQREARQTDASNPSGSMQTLSNPLRYLDELVTVLELPIDLICLEENTICVNKMGIKVSSADRSCDKIHLQEIEIGGNHNNLLALVEIAYGDIS